MSVPTNTTASSPDPTQTAPATQSLIVGLLRGFMELDTQQVVVYNQKWKIPADDRLFITVSSMGPEKQYGATVDLHDSADGKALQEDIAIASREMIGVDIYSKSQAAVNRKEEVMMALASTACQQLCEQWALKIARIPMTFVDLSAVEGTARLNRFQLTFAVLRTRTKSSLVQFYDQFQKPKLVIEP